MLKETKNEQSIQKRGNKFIYTSEREVELEADDILAMATRERVKIDEGTKTISNTKNIMRSANDFLSKHKKIIDEASKLNDKNFCEKCGMDFNLEVNKKNRSNKTKEPYKILCKNCAAKEGL